MTPDQALMATLRRALSLKRPHGSYEEGSLLLSLAFDINRHRPSTKMFVDGMGNLHVDLRCMSRKHKTRNRTLFVAHVDTVHRRGGANVFDSSTPMWKAMGDAPLGADDGAGVAMLAAMIHAGKPAYYIFTRGEECGGVGSKYLADEMAALLAEFERAVAFDRRDTYSVITHQGWGRCCSNKFAEALSAAMNAEGMLMMPDDTGVYTDTAEFVDHIPECTNISAGYYEEHRPTEHLDTQHLQDLLKAALAIDWDALPTERDPLDDSNDFDWNSWRSKYAPKSMATTTPTSNGADLTGEEIDKALDRWAANEAAERMAREGEIDNAGPTDPFSYSDDGGKTWKTGSGRKRSKAH